MVAHEHQGENSHLPSCSPSLTWRLTTNRRALNTPPWWPPCLGTITSHRQLLEQEVCFGTKLEAGFGEVQTTRELPSTRAICSKIFETPHAYNKTDEFKLSTAPVSDCPLLNVLFHQSIIPLTPDVLQFNARSTRKPQAPLTKSLTRCARARYPSHK